MVMFASPEAMLQDLKSRLLQIQDLKAAAAVLEWDQSTYMPTEGAPARARQLATLSHLSHSLLTDPKLGHILELLEKNPEQFTPEDACLIQITRRDYERAMRVPAEFMAQFRQQQATTYAIWVEARAKNNFDLVQPDLQKILEMSRQLASYYPQQESIADPLIDMWDPGMTAAQIRTLFQQLRQELVPLVQNVVAQPLIDDRCLKQDFPEADQLSFALQVAQDYGYDLERGRQDLTHHPFMIKFSQGDVRITTRVQRQDLGEALFSTLHETGHALYELGIAPSLEGTPLNEGISAGVHESQSRLWENLVGRSRPFWQHYYPRLQSIFPSQLGSVPLETFYRAINKVQPSLIRTDADELTYNLHVMVRFDLELDLLEGRLEVKDLPEAWNARYQADFGLVPPHDGLGVLQDVHWYTSQIGGVFQGYTLGNLMAAQFFEAAQWSHPEIPEEIEQGKFSTLHHWLKNNLYQHGRKFTANEILEQATGMPLSIKPYLHYIRRKFGELYDLGE